jgi:hypothetical protein
MNVKTITGLIAAAALAVTLAACTTGGVNQAEHNQQTADAASLEAAQPIPHYNWSQIRQTLIDAETISADSTQTTSFFFMLGARDPIFSCPSIGEPVANTASLSNPQQVVGNGNGGTEVIQQMDPNGVYAPAASSGTYVICVSGSGANYLQYWEGDVMTVAAPAEWDTVTHTLKVIGAPTAAVHTAPGR